jgi:hypothetical protein
VSGEQARGWGCKEEIFSFSDEFEYLDNDCNNRPSCTQQESREKGQAFFILLRHESLRRGMHFSDQKPATFVYKGMFFLLLMARYLNIERQLLAMRVLFSGLLSA